MDGASASIKKLKHTKKWTLHVIKYDRNGCLNEKQIGKILKTK